MRSMTSMKQRPIAIRKLIDNANQPLPNDYATLTSNFQKDAGKIPRLVKIKDPNVT